MPISSDITSQQALRNDIIRKPPTGSPATENPTLSVVTVCFNPLKEGRKELLLQNLRSVQEQTGLTLEHIIIDGASTDGTPQFITSYANPRHEIRLLSKPDTGIYEAMNRGIAIARGKYITFLNSDDYYHSPDGLALSARTLDRTGCSFSFAPILPTGPRLRHLLHRAPQRHLHRILIFPTIPHQSMLYRRTVLEELGGYDPSFRMGGDHDLTLRLIAAGHKGCFVRKAFVTFAEGGFSTQDDALKLREKIRRVRRFHQEVFGETFTDAEAETLVRRYRYPRRCLGVYVASQKLIDSTFVGIPQGPWQRLTHCFNYWKYYLKTLLSL